MKDGEGLSYGMVAVNRNITGKKQADEELVAKEKLTAAVATASNELLIKQDHLKVIEDSLAAIAKAAGTDRSTLVQRMYDEDKNESHFNLKFEWISDHCSKDEATAEFPYVSTATFDDVTNMFEERQVFTSQVEDIKYAWLRDNLLRHRVKSFMAIPVMVEGNLWGVISWQQCAYNRVWEKAEIDTFKSFVITLSAAIERNTAYKKVQESEERLKALFQNSVDIVFVVGEDL
jgi:GAF domain-containing protein